MLNSQSEYLEKIQRQLQLFQIIITLAVLILMFAGIFLFPAFVPYCAIGAVFALARSDFQYHRINNYFSSGSEEKFELWLKKFRYTQLVMPILDFFSLTPIIYLFIFSLNHNFTLPVWLIALFFFCGIAAIPLSVKIAQKN
jgi:hypothetical protein